MRSVFVVGFACLLLGCAPAPSTIQKAELPPLRFTLAELRTAFESNEVRTIGELKSAPVEVTFDVAAIVEEPRCFSVAGYVGEKQTFIGRFTFPKSERSKVSAISKGQTITMRGTFETYDRDLVTFRDAQIVR
jgi:hypothetical protein